MKTIKDLRKQRKLSLEKVAKTLKMSRPTYMKHEKENCVNMYVTPVKKLAKLFELPIMEMVNIILGITHCPHCERPI